MGLFSHRFESIRDLYVNELRDLYTSEIQLIEALPEMAEAATSSLLKEAFINHLVETRVHAGRLEEILQNLSEKPGRENCQAMKGLIKEASEYVKAGGVDEVRDAGLIGAAHRIEHYEMAGYSAARSLALKIGDYTAAASMQSTLSEECAADQTLAAIAESLGVAEQASDFEACSDEVP